MSVVELFGPGLFAMLVLVALVYLLLSLAPVLWPAWRAFRRRDRLPRPFLFVGVVTGLSYGVMSFYVFTFAVPVETYTVFIAPQLQEAGIPHGEALVRMSNWVTDYWWVPSPLMLLAATVWLTAWLARRWDRVCDALG